MLQTDLSVLVESSVPALVWPARRALRLRATAAFWLQASIGLAFLAGSSVPTPLYGVYQARWGFSAITTTVVFGIYAIAVLSALLTLGSLSDRIGRRAVLLGATLAQAVVMLIFATATGVPSLIVARVLQGLATGSAMGAVGAAMLDIDPVRGPLANGLAPIAGTALGGLGAGFLVQYLPYPLHLSYLVLLVVFVALAIGVYLMPETVTAPTARRGHRREGVTAQSLRPRLAVPPAARRPLLLATPMLVAAWAIAGFYGSLGPALVRLVTGSHSALLGGLGYSLVGASAVLAMFALRSASPRRFMLVGTIATLLGVGLTLVAVDSSSLLLLFLGTAGAGVGFGAGFQGAIRAVLPFASPTDRAGVLSTVYVISYLALGVPAVMAGWLVVHGGGLAVTARQYGLTVVALAAISLAGTLRRPSAVAAPPAVPAHLDMPETLCA